jgi:hypothetical protein
MGISHSGRFALSDEKLAKLYRHSDWAELASPDPHYLHIEKVEIPYAVFENEDDVTTRAGEQLAGRLSECLKSLWKRYQR